MYYNNLSALKCMQFEGQVAQARDAYTRSNTLSVLDESMIKIGCPNQDSSSSGQYYCFVFGRAQVKISAWRLAKPELNAIECCILSPYILISTYVVVIMCLSLNDHHQSGINIELHKTIKP